MTLHSPSTDPPRPILIPITSPPSSPSAPKPPPSSPASLTSPSSLSLSDRCRALARSWGHSAISEVHPTHPPSALIHSPTSSSSMSQGNSLGSSPATSSYSPTTSPLLDYLSLKAPVTSGEWEHGNGTGLSASGGTLSLPDIREDPVEEEMQMEMEHSGTEDGGEGEGLKLVQGEEEEEKRILKPEMGEEGGRDAVGEVERSFSVSEAWEPVKKALEEGADYVEAEVWLVDGELLVGKDRDSLSSERTLPSIYIDPLLSHFSSSDTTIPLQPLRRSSSSLPLSPPTPTPFHLLLSLHTDPSSTLPYLLHSLSPLLDANLLTTHCPNSTFTTLRAITVLLSTNCAPEGEIGGGGTQHVFVAGTMGGREGEVVVGTWEEGIERRVQELKASTEARVLVKDVPQDEEIRKKLREAGVDYL